MKKKYMIGSAVIVTIVAVVAAIIWFTSDSKPYDYNLEEYVKVGKYKGLSYDLKEVKVKDKDVDAYIENQIKQTSTLKDLKDAKIADKMTVNIDYEGKIAGKTFEGGTAKGQNVVIGETPMIDGFIDGLKGHKVGDKVTLNLKFPSNYHAKDVAGKDVVFTVKINKVQEKTTPRLDDAFVQSNSKFKTVAEYKKNIKKELQKRTEETVLAQTKQILWQKVLKDSKVIKYPEKEMKEANKKAEKWADKYKAQAKQYGMKWDVFLKNTMKTDKKGFEKIKKDYAKDIVKNDLVLYSIAEKENISISDKEYKDKLDSILKNAKMTKENFKKQYKMSIEEFAEKNNWKQALLLERVVEKIVKLGEKR